MSSDVIRDSRDRAMRNRIRRKRQLHNRLMMCFCTVILVAGFSCFFFGFRAKAQETNEEIAYKYYKSITIESGDTLWRYAKQYGDPRYYDNCNEYIREVKNINSLRSDQITAGCHLILPYYSSL